MGDEKMVSAEEARVLLDGIQPTDLPWKTYRDGRDYVVDAQDCAVCEGDMLRSEARLLAAAPDLARTVIALHKRLEGVGVVECLAARDAATRERERANKAEQALAREKQNSAAREGLLTRLTDALRAAERELDEARAERDRLRSKLINAGESWTRCMGERDRAGAERDRLARAVLDANVSTGGSLYEIDFCPFCGGCLGGPDAGRVEIDGHSPGCVRGELEAADAAREGSDV